MTHGPPRTRVRHTASGTPALAITAPATVAEQSHVDDLILGTAQRAGLSETYGKMGTTAKN